MTKTWEWGKFIIKCMLLIATAIMCISEVVCMIVVPAEEGWPTNEIPVWIVICGLPAVGLGFLCRKIFHAIREDISVLFRHSNSANQSVAEKTAAEAKKIWWSKAPDYVFGNSIRIDKMYISMKDYYDFLSNHEQLFTAECFRNESGTMEWRTTLYVDKRWRWFAYLVTTFADGRPVELNEQTLPSSAPTEKVELSIQKISHAELLTLLRKTVQVSPMEKSLQLALQNHASFEGNIGLKKYFEFACQCKEPLFLEGEHIRDDWERATEVYHQKYTGQLYLMARSGTRIHLFKNTKDVERFETQYGQRTHQTVALHPINHEELRSLLIHGEKLAAAEEKTAENTPSTVEVKPVEEEPATVKEQSAKLTSSETERKEAEEKIAKTQATACEKEESEKVYPVKRREKSITRLEFEAWFPSGVAQKIDAYYDFITNKKWFFTFDYKPSSNNFYTEHGTEIWIDQANGQPYLAKTTGAGVPVGRGCMMDQEDSILDGAPRAISYEEMLTLAEEKYPGLAKEYAGINETNWRDYTKVFFHYKD